MSFVEDAQALQNGGSLVDAACISVPPEKLPEAHSRERKKHSREREGDRRRRERAGERRRRREKEEGR